MNKIFPLTFLMLSLGASENLSAQSPFKSLIQKYRTERDNPPKVIVLPQSNVSLQNKPTAEKGKIQSIVMSEHNGEVYVPWDSTVLHWDENRIPNFDGSTIANLNIQFNNWIDWDLDQPFFKLIDKPDLGYIQERPSEILNFDTAFMHNYNHNANSFNDYEFLIYNTFDALENVSSTVEVEEEDNWIADYRNLYEYNSSGNLTKLSSQDFDGVNWQDEEILTFDYDLNNNMSEYSYKYFESSSNQWIEEERFEFEYDINNNWVSEVRRNSYGGSLDFDEKKIFHYDNNNLRTTEIYAYWENGTWNNSERMEYTYNSNGEITEANLLIWVGGNWGQAGKILFEYDGQGNYNNMIVQVYESSSLTWIPVAKYDYEYINGNLTECALSILEANSFFDVFKINLDYNEDDQLTMFATSEFNGVWEGSDFKYQFYYEEEPSGIKAITNNLNFELYPNPAKQEITVNAGNEKINHIQIADISGKTILSLKTNEGPSKINIPTEQLTNGMYFLHVQSKNAKAVKSFVIQK